MTLERHPDWLGRGERPSFPGARPSCRSPVGTSLQGERQRTSRFARRGSAWLRTEMRATRTAGTAALKSLLGGRLPKRPWCAACLCSDILIGDVAPPSAPMGQQGAARRQVSFCVNMDESSSTATLRPARTLRPRAPTTRTHNGATSSTAASNPSTGRPTVLELERSSVLTACASASRNIHTSGIQVTATRPSPRSTSFR